MQMVKKILIALLAVFFSIAIFAPKRELYYLLEDRLMQYDIIISNEKIHDGFFTLWLEHPQIYFKGIKIAQIKRVDLMTLFLYSRVLADGLTVDESMQKWLPKEIGTLLASYQAFDFRHIALEAQGEFGKAQGYVALHERKIHIDFTEERSIENLKLFLKKGEQGWYYETSY